MPVRIFIYGSWSSVGIFSGVVLTCLQCRKLGLLSPERRLAAKCRTVYQQMWANNGDTLSRQYAGTAALKVSPYVFYYTMIRV